MLFSRRLPLSSLVELCRSLRHNLGAGLPLLDVFRQQARRGPSPVRPVAGRIASKLQTGDDLETALEDEKAYFPAIFLSLAVVGEQTGNMPEVFHELEKYFVLQQKLRRTFWITLAWPLFQFVVAMYVVIPGMLLVLGIIAEFRPDTEPLDPLGLGLLGVWGALVWVAGVTTTLLALFAGYWLVTQVLRQGKLVDSIMLKVPVLGPCLRALALGRFCLALRMTMQTGMSITRAVRLSLKATGNEAFAAAAPELKASLTEGDDLSVALGKSRLFPEEFLNIIANAEEGGRLTEVLEHQTEQYQEEAGRRMTALTWVASILLWVMIGIIIITFALRIIYVAYLKPLFEALEFYDKATGS
jgi:type II secretory pathway component PulF